MEWSKACHPSDEKRQFLIHMDQAFERALVDTNQVAHGTALIQCRRELLTHTYGGNLAQGLNSEQGGKDRSRTKAVQEGMVLGNAIRAFYPLTILIGYYPIHEEKWIAVRQQVMDLGAREDHFGPLSLGPKVANHRFHPVTQLTTEFVDHDTISARQHLDRLPTSEQSPVGLSNDFELEG